MGFAGLTASNAVALLISLGCALPAAADTESEARPAEVHLDNGLALARLGRWQEARAEFLRGMRLRPEDERYLVELGGVAFKQKRHSEAARWLRRAIRLNPRDSYIAEFLGTIYLLQGNVDAALEYWNRIGKPRIETVRHEPRLRVDAVLLDRAFAFAPGSTLRLSDLLTTRARLDGLGIFPTYNIRLNARKDGAFDAAFEAHERNGFGTRWQALLSALRGVVYQTVHPDYFNLTGKAINVETLVRWDPDKRRLLSSLSGPLRSDPRRRFRLTLDLRDENWELRRVADSVAPVTGAFHLRRSAVGASIASFRNKGWSWSTGGEFSHRDYTAVRLASGDALLPGYQVKHFAQVTRDLWRLPVHRFESTLTLSAQTGKVWSTGAHTFETLQISLSASWLPRMSSDDYAIRQQLRAGKLLGHAPFDELFILGLERDNDLWMRAHAGSYGGRKGSALLGRRYFLSNWEIDKNLYRDGLISVKLSPFLDAGNAAGSPFRSGPVTWLWDTGVQAKVRVAGVGFVVSYGKDLRSGNNVLYLTASR